MRDQRSLLSPILITDADIVRTSLNVDRIHHRKESPNAVKMVWRNRQGQMETIDCIPPWITSPKLATVNSEVIVDRVQAWREGHYLAASNLLRRTFVSFTMLTAGRSLLRGQAIEIAHPRPKWSRSIRIKALDWPIIHLADDHGLVLEKIGTLALQSPDGSRWGPVAIRANGDDRRSIIVDLDDFSTVIEQARSDPRLWLRSDEDDVPSAAELGNRQSEASIAVLGTMEGYSVACRVVEVQPQQGGQVAVLAVQDVDDIYSADELLVPDDTSVAVGDLSTAGAWRAVTVTGEVVIEGDDVDTRFMAFGTRVAGAVGYEIGLLAETNLSRTLRAETSAEPFIEVTVSGDRDRTVYVQAFSEDARGPRRYFRVHPTAPGEAPVLADEIPNPNLNGA